MGKPAWVIGSACAILIGCARRPEHAISPTAFAPLFPTPVLSGLLGPILPPSTPSVLFLEPFDHLDLSQWREVEVKGRTDYRLETVAGSSSLKAHSRGGASVLLRLIRYDPGQYAWLSWRWRVEQFVEGEDLAVKKGSDASARVYVYFETRGLPWQKRNLDYVWSTTTPVDTILESAYAKTSKIVVVESGRASPGVWRGVRRNVDDDYRRCFGEDPPNVVAIGVMTDADSTGTEAVADYDDVMISAR